MSKWALPIFFFVSAFLIEIFTFCSLGFGMFPTYAVYDISVILIITGIVYLCFNYIAQYVVSAFFLVCQLALSFINFSLYNLNDGAVFSWDMVNLITATAHAMSSDFVYVWYLLAVIGIGIADLLIGLLILIKIRKTTVPIKSHFSVAFVMMFVIVECMGTSSFAIQTVNENATTSYSLSGKILKDSTLLKSESLKSYGTYGYYIENAVSTIFNRTTKSDEEEAIEFFESGNIHDADDSSAFGVSENENVIVIMVESLEWITLSDGNKDSHTLSNELTPNIYKLIDEGFISSNFFAISKTNISEGVGFMGSYPAGKYLSQIVSSDNSSNFLYTLPNVLKENGYTTTYAHPNNGSFYSRKSSHANLGFDNIVFGDDVTGKTITWGHWMTEEDFVTETIDTLIPESAKDGQKFFTFYTSVSSHGAYDDNSYNNDQVQHKEEVLASNWYQNICKAYTDDRYRNYLVNYESAIVGLDKAIGVLIEQLENYGIYDNTTIVLYSDHNSYYHSLSYHIKGVELDDSTNKNLNTIPMVVKSNGVNNALATKGYYSNKNKTGLLLTDETENNFGFAKDDNTGTGTTNTNDDTTNTENDVVEISGVDVGTENDDIDTSNVDSDHKIISTSRFTSAYDIVPTILDILGISYNENLYVGTSLFEKVKTTATLIDKEQNEKEIEVTAFYSLYTTSLHGQYTFTKNLKTFTTTLPDGITSIDYEKKFKGVAVQLIKKIYYISMLYTNNIYSMLEK